MVNIAIVQGRLSTMVGDRYQHFPIHAWREEFRIASEIGFNGIEWIISDFSNPLFDSTTVNEVQKISDQFGVGITSISLDTLMYHPIFKQSWNDITWLFDRISFIVEQLGTKRISIPIEEHSGIRSPTDADATLGILHRILDRYGKKIQHLCLETDLSPQNVQKILSIPGLEDLGLLVDLGNIAANGFKLGDFTSLCGARIHGFHVKDRLRGFGPSCPLGKGSAELAAALSCAGQLPRLSDVTLQAFRSPHCFIEDARAALKFTRTLLNGS